jgi:hypothetical protein
MSDKLKNGIARALAVLGVVALACGGVLGQVRRGLFDSQAFADRLASSLTDRRVSAYVADAITTAIIREKPDLIGVRPLLLSTAGGVVESDGFARIVRVAARQAHVAVFSRGGRNLLLSVPDVDLVLRGALAHASPTLAANIPARLPTLVANLGGSSASRFILDLWQIGRHLLWAARVGVFGGLALLILGIFVAPRRAPALRRASLDLALAGLFLIMLEPLGRVAVSSLPDAPLAREAAAGIYDAFSGGLRQLALCLAGVGLVFCAAAQTLVSRRSLPDAARKVARWLAHPPPSTGQQLLRGALYLAAGVAMVLRPSTTLAVLALAAGGCLAFVGLQQLFQLVIGTRPEALPADIDASVTGKGAKQRAIEMLVIAGVVAMAIAWLGRPRERALLRKPPGCNGDQRLCDKHLDQVVFAGTHNAMSAANRSGWMFAAQERDLAAQLDDGVRALLIDVHAGVPVSGRIKTEMSGGPGFVREMEKAVGSAGLQAAERIRERLVGPAEGPRALYLCHGFCELGAEPFVPWLRTLREFMVANPNDVVLLVLEDYVAPSEIAAAFADSGLGDFVFHGATRPPPPSPWPTLQKMVDSGQRVVAFLESGKPGVDWLHPAFEAIQETPYRFLKLAEFSCAPNRGGTRGSLFQINHWIETAPTPRPSNAAVVNAYDFLLARAQHCRAERAHIPNIIAVDFYRTGELFRVVKHLNGLDDADK